MIMNSGGFNHDQTINTQRGPTEERNFAERNSILEVHKTRPTRLARAPARPSSSSIFKGGTPLIRKIAHQTAKKKIFLYLFF